MFSVNPSSGLVSDNLSSSAIYSTKMVIEKSGDQAQDYGVEGWGDSNGTGSFKCGQEFNQNDLLELQLQTPSSDDPLCNLSISVFSPRNGHGKILSRSQSVVDHKKENSSMFCLASLELLTRYSNRFKELTKERVTDPTNVPVCSEEQNCRMSTEENMKSAREWLVQSFCQKLDVAQNPFNFSFYELSKEQRHDVELLDLLLASAEKVNNQEYQRATRLLSKCDELSSKYGTHLQRIVYYFSQAFHERIARETTATMGKLSFEFEHLVIGHPAAMSFVQQVPLGQIEKIASIQAIIENVAHAKRVHIIDLHIRGGVQWPLLMQALASRQEGPLEILKITAIAGASEATNDTAKRLTSFAATMKLPFSFKVVSMSDMIELKNDLFEFDDDEAVAVYSMLFLWTLISRPVQLHSLMAVIRKIKPRIIVVGEFESNTNSPVLMNRFIEALFFFSAYFDCFSACLKKNIQHRIAIETWMGQGIMNILGAEGEERTVRHVKIGVWRDFLSRFGLVEKELSMSSLCQADLMVKKFSPDSSVTVDMDGKSLIVGWKGIPIQSLSVWKFA